MKLMTTTFPKLERSCSYTHSGELFSRVLLLQENAQNESLVLIVSGKDFLKKYQKISQDL